MSHDSHEHEEKHAGYGWLLFCIIGMMTSLTLYGIVLEYCTSGGRKLHELSFVFVTTSIYALTAYIARPLVGEKPSNISKYHMLTLSLTSIASTFTSVRSLRYVIYPVQVLFKSCKPVPVMIFGLLLGKKYSMRKYVNVIIITTGVALFMGGGDSTKAKGSTEGSGSSDMTIMGAMLLSVSLCFDGATGAYEDKLMAKDHVEPFDLMYNIQFGKAVISFCCLVATNGLNDFVNTLSQGGLSLVILGLTGALGQVFVFITISKFGALNCALIGLARKIVSLLLSFVLYGHTLNAFQTVGLALSIVAMIANFYEKGGKKKEEGGSSGSGKDAKEAPSHEKVGLLQQQSQLTGDEEEGSEAFGDEDALSIEGFEMQKAAQDSAPGIGSNRTNPMHLLPGATSASGKLVDVDLMNTDYTTLPPALSDNNVDITKMKL